MIGKQCRHKIVLYFLLFKETLSNHSYFSECLQELPCQALLTWLRLTTTNGWLMKIFCGVSELIYTIAYGKNTIHIKHVSQLQNKASHKHDFVCTSTANIKNDIKITECPFKSCDFFLLTYSHFNILFQFTSARPIIIMSIHQSQVIVLLPFFKFKYQQIFHYLLSHFTNLSATEVNQQYFWSNTSIFSFVHNKYWLCYSLLRIYSKLIPTALLLLHFSDPYLVVTLLQTTSIRGITQNVQSLWTFETMT